ncbi:MAG: hypothetical protein ACRDSP_06270 [Pseudonocardiaceae bacterium]
MSPATLTARHPGRCGPAPGRGPARTRVVMMVVGLVLALLLGLAGVGSAAASPAPGAALAPDPVPCTGAGCLPQPLPPPPPGGGAGVVPGQAPGQADSPGHCGITGLGDVSGCVTDAISGFFKGLVADALNPLLGLLSATLLSTPTPDQLPRVGQLWAQSWQIVLGCYGLLVTLAGVVVMAYESLQTRYSVKQIAPRVVVGFLTGAVSLFLAEKAITVANALTSAVLGGGVDPATAGPALENMVLASLSTGGIFLAILALFLVAGLVALLLTYLVRVAITLILVAGAPLALMCHALPQTEPVAYWWWRAFGACLGIQIAQSLTLVTGLRVLLAPGGFTPFGPTRSGLVNVLIALALLYILIKIPFWLLGALRIGGGRRSVVATVARGYVIGTTLGWVRGSRPPTRHPGPHGGAGGGGGGRGPRGRGGPRGGGGPGGGGGGGGGPRGSGPRGGGPRGPRGGGHRPGRPAPATGAARAGGRRPVQSRPTPSAPSPRRPPTRPAGPGYPRRPPRPPAAAAPTPARALGRVPVAPVRRGRRGGPVPARPFRPARPGATRSEGGVR